MTQLFLFPLLFAAAVNAQTPGSPAPQTAAPRPAAPAVTAPAGASAVPTGGTKVAVINFGRAMTENTEGKRANEQFNGELTRRQSAFEAKQKKAADFQGQLQTQDKVLSDAAKANITRQLEQLQTEMARDNEDAQRDLQAIQQQLFAPIMERVQKVVKDYAAEYGFAVVFDVSGQTDNIVYFDDVADITTEIIRKADATAPKAPAAPAGAPRTPATAAPGITAPPRPAPSSAPPTAAPRPPDPARKP